MSATILAVGTAAELNDAIATVNAAATGAFTIRFTANITESADLRALSLASGVTVTIDGEDHALDGANTYRGLFVYAGAVTIEDLTIRNARAKGGDGGNSGGGGGGLGGGLFVAAAGNVTLDDVAFSGNSAVGGAGGAGYYGSNLAVEGLGGGGGLGGNGGNGGVNSGLIGGGGGGLGTGAVGGGPGAGPEAGLLPGAGGGAAA
jgi:hypothetical protein